MSEAALQNPQEMDHANIAPAVAGADGVSFVLAPSEADFSDVTKELIEMGGFTRVRQYNMKGMGSQTASQDISRFLSLGEIPHFSGQLNGLSLEDLRDQEVPFDAAMEIDMLRAFGHQAPDIAPALIENLEQARAAYAAGDMSALDTIESIMSLVTQAAAVKKLEGLVQQAKLEIPNFEDVVAALQSDSPALEGFAEGKVELATALTALIADVAQNVAALTTKLLEKGAIAPAIVEAIQTRLTTSAEVTGLQKEIAPAIAQLERQAAPAQALQNDISALTVTLEAMLARDDLTDEAREQIEAVLESLENHPEGQPLTLPQLAMITQLAQSLGDAQGIASILQIADQDGGSEIELPADIVQLIETLQTQIQNTVTSNTALKAEILNLPPAVVAQMDAVALSVDTLQNSLQEALAQDGLSDEAREQIQAVLESLENHPEGQPLSLPQLALITELAQNLAGAQGTASILQAVAQDGGAAPAIPSEIAQLIETLQTQIQNTVTSNTALKAEILSLPPAIVAQMDAMALSVDTLQNSLQEVLSQDGLSDDIRTQIESVLDSLQDHPAGQPLTAEQAALLSEIAAPNNEVSALLAASGVTALVKSSLSQSTTLESATPDIPEGSIAQYEAFTSAATDIQTQLDAFAQNAAVLETLSPIEQTSFIEATETLSAAIQTLENAEPNSPEAIQASTDIQAALGDLPTPVTAALAPTILEQTAFSPLVTSGEMPASALGAPEAPEVFSAAPEIDIVDNTAPATAEASPQDTQGGDAPSQESAEQSSPATETAEQDAPSQDPDVCPGGPNCTCGKHFNDAAANDPEAVVATLNAELPSTMSADVDGGITVQHVNADGSVEERHYSAEEIKADEATQQDVQERLEEQGYFDASANDAQDQALEAALVAPNEPVTTDVNLTEEFHKCGPDCFHNQTLDTIAADAQATESSGPGTDAYDNVSADQIDFAPPPSADDAYAIKPNDPNNTGAYDEIDATKDYGDQIKCQGKCKDCKLCFAAAVEGIEQIQTDTDDLIASLKTEAANTSTAPAEPEESGQKKPSQKVKAKTLR